MKTSPSHLIAAICLISLGALSGCSSKMTKQDCDAKDYYSMGQKDGDGGKSTEQFDRLSNECTQLGSNVRADQYKSGRTVGLSHFCTESRGKSDAKSGKTDSVCVAESFPPYMASYQSELNSLKGQRSRELDKAKAQQSQSEKKAATLQNQINGINSQQGAVQGTPQTN